MTEKNTMLEAFQHVNELHKDIDAIAAEYGESIALAVTEMYQSLLSMHVLLLCVNDPAFRLVLTEVAATSTARVCRLCEKAFNLTTAQVTEALGIAKDLHTKSVESARKHASNES